MAPVTETEEFKKLASELYKKNLDLFNANRTLTILQKLYQIMAQALKIEEMAEQYLKVIVTDMNFLSGAVFVKYSSEEYLRPVAQVNSNVDLNVKISLKDTDNLVANTYNNGQKMWENNENGDIKSTVYYPILFGDAILGVFTISMGVTKKSLSETDNLILDRVSTVFGIAMDRLLLYLGLESANQKLKFLDEQKTEFLNVASHELRAPMTAIRGYLSMAQGGDGGEIPVAAQELLSEAAVETDRMIRLVNNMLNVARIEEGRMVFEPGIVQLNEVVERVFNEFKFEADNKALQYVYEPGSALQDKVEVDVDRIHEVVANLINNAIKYTDEGKVVVKVTNPPSPKATEGQVPQVVRFEVSDTGPGMTPDEQAKLFQKFYRTESYIGKKMGTGLGLYISRLLVQKFGGQIGVKSEKGKGSLFWFELPIKS